MSYFVYILASRKNGTLYIGVTNEIAKRVHEHHEGIGSKVANKYAAYRLVYVETHDTAEIAIQREKTLKKWPRVWKIRQIEAVHPKWHDLIEDIHC